MGVQKFSRNVSDFVVCYLTYLDLIAVTALAVGKTERERNSVIRWSERCNDC